MENDYIINKTLSETLPIKDKLTVLSKLYDADINWYKYTLRDIYCQYIQSYLVDNITYITIYYPIYHNGTVSYVTTFFKNTQIQEEIKSVLNKNINNDLSRLLLGWDKLDKSKLFTGFYVTKTGMEQF